MALLRLLLIEDNPGDARLVREAVRDSKDARIELDHAERLDAGLRSLAEGAPDAVLLDLSLPDASGLDGLLKVQAAAPQLPVVILTSLADEDLAAKAVRSGAQDYLVKGRVDGESLMRAVRYAIERKRAELGRLAKLVTPPSTGPARFDAGTTVAGRYRLERLLGAGGFGTAFLAADRLLGRPVVLKALQERRAATEKGKRDFLSEARVAASLEHENVVRIYDFGHEGDTPYIVMEYADGGSLSELLDARGPLPPGECVRIMDGVLAGLGYMHSQGILHRDLKPGNILLSGDGGVKITDFGLSVGTSDATKERLDAPSAPGTPAFMSPEAVAGGTLTPESDIYSCGAVLYQMLAGKAYLDLAGRDPHQIRRMILEIKPKPPPGPAPLRDTAMRALEKDPRKRYPGAEAMRAAVRKAI